MKIHVALVSAYPTETEARAAMTAENPNASHTPYRGTWTHPTPERPLVHVFSHATDEQLEAAGWTREDA